MRILLVSPPYLSLTSPSVGHQIPFGLLCVGGPLLTMADDFNY